MKKTLSTLLLSTVLMAPVAVRAMDDHDRDRDAQGRYYDPAFRDYHEWNDHEEHAYREYLKERHRENKEWAKKRQKGTGGVLEMASQASGRCNFPRRALGNSPGDSEPRRRGRGVPRPYDGGTALFTWSQPAL